MTQKGRPKNSDIDKKIMEAVKSSIEKYDIKDFSMEMVVKEAKIAKQTLYNRFSSKLELLLEFLNYLALQKVVVKTSGTYIEKIESIIFPAIDYSKSNYSSLLKLIVMESSKDEKSSVLVRDAFINKRRKVLIDVINEAKEKDEIKDTIDSDTLCNMLFGSIWYKMIFNIEESENDKKNIIDIVDCLFK